MQVDWRELLRSSVTPLNSGVAGLAIRGWYAPGDHLKRPGRTAAVLVGVLDRDSPEIILTQRALHLPQHPGQISFPGGAMAAREETGVVTALREAHEEIGLRPDNVVPIGFLDRLDTISDYRVLPVVGLVRQCGPWTPDHREVEEVFSLPLQHALELSAYERLQLERGGVVHQVYSLQWEHRRIWGVTAAILHNLARRSQQAAEARPHGSGAPV